MAQTSGNSNISTSASSDNVFGDSFPFNLINKEKIVVNYDFNPNTSFDSDIKPEPKRELKIDVKVNIDSHEDELPPLIDVDSDTDSDITDDDMPALEGYRPHGETKSSTDREIKIEVPTFVPNHFTSVGASYEPVAKKVYESFFSSVPPMNPFTPPRLPPIRYGGEYRPIIAERYQEVPVPLATSDDIKSRVDQSETESKNNDTLKFVKKIIDVIDLGVKAIDTYLDEHQKKLQQKVIQKPCDDSEDDSESDTETDSDEDIYEEDLEKKAQDQPNANHEPEFVGYANVCLTESTPEDIAYVKAYLRDHPEEGVPDFDLEEDEEKAEIECKKEVPEVCETKAPVMIDASEHPVTFAEDGSIITDISFSGKNWKVIFDGVPIVKLTNESGCHHGVHFQEGLIVDPNTFKYDMKCGPDGIYCCKLSDVEKWIDYSVEPMVYMWDVEVDDESRCCMYSNKLKVDRLYLSNKRKIVDYIANKLVNMAHDCKDPKEVLEYLNHLPKSARPVDQMDEVNLALLSRDINLFSQIPEDEVTYNVAMFVAQNDPNAFDKLKDVYMSDEIIDICLNRDHTIYRKLDLPYISHKMSNEAFEKDHSVYEIMPEEHRTKDMTIRYLLETKNPDFSKHIPSIFMNIPVVLDRVIRTDGMRLVDVEFRNKNYAVCTLAVTNNGKALQYVPFSVVDYDLCVKAVSNTNKAYEYVPQCYKTTSLNEKMIECHPKNGFEYIPLGEVTHAMIMSVAKFNPESLCDLMLDSDHDDIEYLLGLFTKHMDEYIEVCPTICNYVPVGLFTDRQAIELVKINNNVFDMFRHRSVEFCKECVKVGVDFSVIPEKCINLELLNELVTARANVIDELPCRYDSDDLYIICMKVHGYKLKQVPEEFRTSKLLSVAFNLYPEDSVIKADDIDVSGIETKQYTDSVRFVEDYTSPVTTSIEMIAPLTANNRPSNDSVSVSDLQ